MEMRKKGKALSLFGLIMMNIIAVDSLRTLPISAAYGTSLIFYYVLAGICFFLPTILITAELAIHWPNTGGVYVWVREAFGQKWGLLTIWLQWIYNVIWYPTILAFLAVTLAPLINPALATHKIYTLSIINIVFWGATWLNCQGIRLSSWVSSAGALIGTLIPMLVIIGLGTLWFWHGYPSQLVFNKTSLLPDLHNINNLGFLTAVLFGLMGMEMSAVHAGDVNNPSKTYPRALLYSGILILATLIGGSLAIATVIPPKQISLTSSLVEAYAIFFKSYHLEGIISVIILMIILSGLASVSTWIIGPTRGLWVASQEIKVLNVFVKLNKKGMPARILVLQGVVVTLLCLLFLGMPSINAAYWILTALTSQLALLFYMLMFAAAIRLRSHVRMWIIAGVGIFFTLGIMLLGFIPPPNMSMTLHTYETILMGGMLLFILPPLALSRLV